MTYDPQLHVVLYEPEIPQNTGNVGRSCLACGAKLWLVRPLGFRLDEKRLRRAGLDYWRHLQWEAVDGWSDLERRLPCARRWFFSSSGARLYSSVRYRPGDALVFGCETRGLPSTLWESQGDGALRIPVRPPVRSLNLAAAVAVALFEALRQWRECGEVEPCEPVG